MELAGYLSKKAEIVARIHEIKRCRQILKAHEMPGRNPMPLSSQRELVTYALDIARGKWPCRVGRRVRHARRAGIMRDARRRARAERRAA
jgi:hypothetical protein